MRQILQVFLFSLVLSVCQYTLAEDSSNKHEKEFDRITSYNVCYTKLLRNPYSLQ